MLNQPTSLGMMTRMLGLLGSEPVEGVAAEAFPNIKGLVIQKDQKLQL
jgi:hypothetical protein